MEHRSPTNNRPILEFPFAFCHTFFVLYKNLMTYALLLSGILLTITTIGIFFPYLRTWSDSFFRFLLSFGAGIMLSVAFVHMLPDAMESISEQAPLYFIFGFLLLYILENFVMVHACDDDADQCKAHHIGIPAFFGFFLHALLDGIAIGAALSSSITLGTVVFFSILLHKFPESVSLAGLLKHSRYKHGEALPLLIPFALATPVGIIGSVLGFPFFPAETVGIALAVAGGTFLYISSSDLMPEVHKHHHGKYWALLAFLIGFAIPYGVTFLE